MVISLCFVRSKIAGMSATARNFRTIQAIAPLTTYPIAIAMVATDQKRLDNQEWHQENQQYERRGQAIDQRGEGLLETRPRYKASERPPDCDQGVPPPGDDQKHHRQREQSCPSHSKALHR